MTRNGLPKRALTFFRISVEILTELLCNRRATVTSVCHEQIYSSGTGTIYSYQDMIRLATEFPLLKTLLYYSPRVTVSSKRVSFFIVIFDTYDGLSIFFFLFQAKHMPKNLPTCANLKHLVLIIYESLPEKTYSLLEPMITFLKASPLLHKLEMHVSISIQKTYRGKLFVC